jgi:hypothetical protein
VDVGVGDGEAVGFAEGVAVGGCTGGGAHAGVHAVNIVKTAVTNTELRKGMLPEFFSQRRPPLWVTKPG